jgi:hypothetical protein
MKKIYPALLLVVVAAFFALASCKKDSNSNLPGIKLSVTDSAKTISVSPGQTISITLGNPGDGGYQFNTWQYNAGVLHLDSHTHANPANPMSMVGDFGTDTWQFTPLSSGTSLFKITASRGTTDVVTMFNGKISVK